MGGPLMAESAEIIRLASGGLSLKRGGDPRGVPGLGPAARLLSGGGPGTLLGQLPGGVGDGTGGKGGGMRISDSPSRELSAGSAKPSSRHWPCGLSA